MKENAVIIKAKSISEARKRIKKLFGDNVSNVKISIVRNAGKIFGITVCPLVIQATVIKEQNETPDINKS
ncbi:MAG: hypothetical protein M0R40_06580 [Firmicutes bacterium]|nr:hypothetical protein [Bacillota bacterium]